jgi:hypothetical protein
MVDERAMPPEPVTQQEDTLTHIPRAEFVAAWKALVGEPPAAMLESQSEMIRVLVDSTSVAQPAGVGICAEDETDG